MSGLSILLITHFCLTHPFCFLLCISLKCCSPYPNTCHVFSDSSFGALMTRHLADCRCAHCCFSYCRDKLQPPTQPACRSFPRRSCSFPFATQLLGRSSPSRVAHSSIVVAKTRPDNKQHGRRRSRLLFFVSSSLHNTLGEQGHKKHVEYSLQNRQRDHLAGNNASKYKYSEQILNSRQPGQQTRSIRLNPEETHTVALG